MRFIDPDGLWEIEVNSREIINKKGKKTGRYESYITFVAEEGDDINTLAEQTGLDIDKLKKGLGNIDITKGTALEKFGIKRVDRSIRDINNLITDQKMAAESNCWGTSISMERSGYVDFNVDGKGTGIIPDPNRADQILQNEFRQTDKPALGNIVRYAYEDGNEQFKDDFDRVGYVLVSHANQAGGTSHYATFLLKNQQGKIFVFSKNGAGAAGKWVVTSDNNITGPDNYGNRSPLGNGSPYYKSK